MKLLVNIIRSSARLLQSTLTLVYNTLDETNLAWHESKALDNFQTTLADRPDIVEITEISVFPAQIEEGSNCVEVAIVTKNIRSRYSIFTIERILKDTNSRFNTHLSAHFVQSQVKTLRHS